MKNGQLVMGPAGSGKSTYCLEIYKNIKEKNFPIKIVNLDPSLENFYYPSSIDIRDLIKTKDVMKELSLGPNGSLVFCMEYLMDNLSWLKKEILTSFETFFIFDLPGQVELYSHSNLLNELVIFLNDSCEIWVYGLFFLDCHFINDVGKFLGGSLTALCCMISLEISHYNILNKMDLLQNLPGKIIERYLYPDPIGLLSEINQVSNIKYRKLNRAIINLLEDFSMIRFIPLDVTKIDNLRKFFLDLYNENGTE
mmetsp:Transcript_60496/g.124519  ORF Transcript_60496/g.124519 Transcript_60496/m.124519 type:complete len:253 (-) Transcript_60496:674-1432(-)